MPSEKAIDEPSRQTLGILAAVCAATLIMWAGGKMACNYHPPTETRKPRELATAELANNPKDAAIELQQRWAKLDFDRALELATGSAADAIRTAQQECKANLQSCETRRKQLQDKALTTATLLQRDLGSALVRVTTLGIGTPAAFLMQLEPAGVLWKAKSRRPDTGPASPEPSAPMPAASTPSPTP